VNRSEWLTALLETIHDGVVAVDAEWCIAYLNGAAESLLRVSRTTIQGQSLWDFIPESASELRANLEATMRDGLERELRNVRPNRAAFRGRIFDIRIAPLPGGGLSLTLQDVRDRVQRESELVRLAAEASEANRAKARFFAAASHELRTPLNAIVGYTHLLSSETYGPMPEAARRAAYRSGICAEHLARLVDDLLLMTTAEIGRISASPAPVVLEDFLPEALEPLRLQAEAKGLSFSVDVASGLPRVQTDPERLRQILFALVSNAVKFTSTGEIRVVASAASGPLDTADSEWRGGVGAGGVEIRVSDTGPGIPPEDRERVFHPFEQLGDSARTHSALRGTGLGLSVAQQLATLLHGKLSIEDTPVGASFCLALPAKLEAE